jgi:hypothetical protein
MDRIIGTDKEVDYRFGAGSELGRMMHAALNPNPETWEQRLARNEQEYFAKATKIDAKDYTGWVSWPGHGPNNGYFKSVDELLTFCANNKLDAPQWVWACTPEPLKLHADWILDQALEEHYDGARGEISDAEEKRLQAFLDEWAMAQKIVSWHEDRTRAVLLVPEQEISFPKPVKPPPIYVAVPSQAEESTEAQAGDEDRIAEPFNTHEPMSRLIIDGKEAILGDIIEIPIQSPMTGKWTITSK